MFVFVFVFFVFCFFFFGFGFLGRVLLKCGIYYTIAFIVASQLNVRLHGCDLFSLDFLPIFFFFSIYFKLIMHFIFLIKN